VQEVAQAATQPVELPNHKHAERDEVAPSGAILSQKVSSVMPVTLKSSSFCMGENDFVGKKATLPSVGPASHFCFASHGFSDFLFDFKEGTGSPASFMALNTRRTSWPSGKRVTVTTDTVSAGARSIPGSVQKLLHTTLFRLSEPRFA
jgi:hypothetical protein